MRGTIKIMSKEVWRDIEGYEGKYQVSNKGRVKSLNYHRSDKKKILKQSKHKSGYLYVALYKDGERKYYGVHRMVAQAFLSNPENYPEVNHKDENPLNNCVENLEWCTREYNINYGTRIERFVKTVSKQVMCVETGEIFNTIKEAHEKTGIVASCISGCVNHKKRYRTARRCHWEYV